MSLNLGLGMSWPQLNSLMPEEEIEQIIIDPDSRVCGNCDHWKEEDDERDYYGRCHRFPAQGIWNGETILWRFPLKESLNGCGEFQQRLMGKVKLEVSDAQLERNEIE